MGILCILILAFQFVFLLRMVLSFFPLAEESLGATIRGLCLAATEPVVMPVRRALPPLPGVMAGFGIAELMVLIGLQIVGGIICSLA